jgi:hypothetical protein
MKLFIERILDYATIELINISSIRISIGIIYLMIMLFLALLYWNRDIKTEWKVASVIFFGFVLALFFSEFILSLSRISDWVMGVMGG